MASNGLTSAEAAARLAAEGANALPGAARHSTVAIALGVVREPMFLLLLAASAVYLALGDLHEALVLAASIVVVVALAVVQERKAERALEALRDLSSPRALVVRDGERRRIAGVEVVRGDLLVLAEGDRVQTIGDGFRVEAHIVVFRQDNALKAPVGALFRDGAGWALFVAEGERARKRAVKVVRRNGAEAMLEDGVKPGERVVVYPSDALADGARVEARSAR